MQATVTVRLDLSATTNTHSVSEEITVPAWARQVAVHPAASSWGTGPSVVDLKSLAPGMGATWHVLSPAVTFTDSTPQRNIDVRGLALLRLETTSAGASSPDTDAQFTLVFTDILE